MTGGFIFPKILVSKIIAKGSTFTEIYATIYFTGEITFLVSANNGVNWEEVEVFVASRTKHTFTNTGTDLLYMVILNPGATIYTLKDSETKEFLAPAVKIEITGVN